jgi:hypothetical protein
LSRQVTEATTLAGSFAVPKLIDLLCRPASLPKDRVLCSPMSGPHFTRRKVLDSPIDIARHVDQTKHGIVHEEDATDRSG